MLSLLPEDARERLLVEPNVAGRADDHQPDLAVLPHRTVVQDHDALLTVRVVLAPAEIDLGDVPMGRLHVARDPVATRQDTEPFRDLGGIAGAIPPGITLNQEVIPTRRHDDVEGEVALHPHAGHVDGQGVGEPPGHVVRGPVAHVARPLEDLLTDEHATEGSIARGEVRYIQELPQHRLLQLQRHALGDLPQTGLELAGGITPPDADPRQGHSTLEKQRESEALQIAQLGLVVEELGLGVGHPKVRCPAQGLILIVHLEDDVVPAPVRPDRVGAAVEDERIQTVIREPIRDAEREIVDDLRRHGQADPPVVLRGPLDRAVEGRIELNDVTRTRHRVRPDVIHLVRELGAARVEDGGVMVPKDGLLMLAVHLFFSVPL